MSTRYNDGSHYENHQRSAELHDLAAHAHRSAAEQPEKQDHLTGQQRSRQALEHSQKAHEHSTITAAFGHDEIARLARELWQQRGCLEGSPETDWYAAAEELRSRNSGVK
jgi:hypothetical protein